MSSVVTKDEWSCAVCLTANPASADYCGHCWAPREAMQEPGPDVVLRTRLRRLRERRRGVAVRVAFALAALIALWLATDTPGLSSSLPKPSSAAGPATSPGAWAMAGYDAVQSFAPAGGSPGLERPAWAFPFEGAEAAPPVVANGAVYLTVRPDRVLALDVETGGVRWERRLAGPLHGSPAVTDDAVIVAQAPGTVTGLDRNSGRVVWDVEAEGLLFASPAVHEGALYVASAERKLVAIDLATLAHLWTVDLDRAVYRTPSVNGEYIALAADVGTLDIVDLKTGKLRFSFGPARDALVQSPVLLGESAIIARGGRVYAVNSAEETGWFERRVRSFEAQLFAWGLRSAPPGLDGLRWSQRVSPADLAGLAAREAVVYAATRDGQLHALDADSGDVRSGRRPAWPRLRCRLSPGRSMSTWGRSRETWPYSTGATDARSGNRDWRSHRRLAHAGGGRPLRAFGVGGPAGRPAPLTAASGRAFDQMRMQAAHRLGATSRMGGTT